jgi:hypothetical protein
VHQSYRYALDPNNAQAMARHAGAARFCFTWCLARVKAGLGQRAPEASYGVAGEALVRVGWMKELRAAFNQAKDNAADLGDHLLDDLAREAPVRPGGRKLHEVIGDRLGLAVVHRATGAAVVMSAARRATW